MNEPRSRSTLCVDDVAVKTSVIATATAAAAAPLVPLCVWKWDRKVVLSMRCDKWTALFSVTTTTATTRREKTKTKQKKLKLTNNKTKRRCNSVWRRRRRLRRTTTQVWTKEEKKKKKREHGQRNYRLDVIISSSSFKKGVQVEAAACRLEGGLLCT